MKRIISILLIFLMLLSLCGCGGTSTSKVVSDNDDLFEALATDDVTRLTNLINEKKIDTGFALKACYTFEAQKCFNYLVDTGVEISDGYNDKSLLEYSIGMNSCLGTQTAIEQFSEIPTHADMVSAIKDGKTASAYAMIINGVDATTIGTENYTILHEMTSRIGYGTYYKSLLSETGAEFYEDNNRVCKYFYYDGLFVQAAVSAGVDVNAKTIYGKTAYDLNPQYVMYFIENGFNCKADSEDVIKSVIEYGNPEYIAKLPECGYDITSKAYWAMKDVFEPYQTYILDTLKDIGYDFGGDGGVALLYSLCEKLPTIVAMESHGEGTVSSVDEYKNVIQFLITEGVNVNYNDGKGETPIWKAMDGAIVLESEEASTEFLDILQLLVDAGANPNPNDGKKYMTQDTVFTSFSSVKCIKKYKERFGLH